MKTTNQNNVKIYISHRFTEIELESDSTPKKLIKEIESESDSKSKELTKEKTHLLALHLKPYLNNFEQTKTKNLINEGKFTVVTYENNHPSKIGISPATKSILRKRSVRHVIIENDNEEKLIKKLTDEILIYEDNDHLKYSKYFNDLLLRKTQNCIIL